MSGAGRTTFNISSQIRLGRDLLLRNCRENYAGDTELGELIRWHHGFVIPRKLSWSAEERESSIPHDLSWTVWHGEADDKQRAEWKKIATAWRKKCAAKGRVSFCETSYSEPIWHTCDVALHHTKRGKGTQCHIRGDAGCGKTIVARAWHQTNNHGCSVFWEPKGAGGIRAALEDLALLMGVDRGCSYAKLIERVFACFEPGMVLIVDEIHLLIREGSVKQPVLDLIRRICDTTGCSIISLATDDKFESDLSSSTWNDRQWWRRMSRIVDLPRVSPDPQSDVRALYEFKFPDFDLSKILLDNLLLINGHDKGGFGAVAKIFDDAEVEAQLDERTVKVQDIITCTAEKQDALDAVLRRSLKKDGRKSRK